ncbi:glycoside hydrolase family 79 protein [Zasmidium cellare ATCC 36951]|uniref:Glycoside hydrolase family 79 protein n=1 Tax=Zasmidium cellare ATCC 36951 TaxID=1080233 RepID=A0A6A6BYY8_ZASCE|nr:glycoside hydrolase family 79 protein [Zasmidium cellare ATCC 36951]KAF2159925.1 glycoside hydrolase family 79 protein [Zasmidium cellare ATCC 36951]
MKLSLFSFFFIGVLAKDATVTISAPTTQPTTASPPVDKSFLGIMVETTSWFQYGLQDFSRILIQNLVTRSGAPVIIRVGGTSGDSVKYNSSQPQGNFWPYNNTKEDGLLSPVTLGVNFTKALDKVPNVRYIIQVPLANSTVDNTVNFTKAMLQHIPAEKFEAIEVGNEPNLYDGQCFRSLDNCRRNKTYTPEDYVADLQIFTTAITQQVPNLPSGDIFHVGSLADAAQWSAADLYKANLGKVSRIKAFAQHYYQASISQSPTLRGTYLNHSGSVLHKVNKNPQVNLDYFRSAKIDTPIVISEAGSSLGSRSPFERTIDAVLGSALWELDWVLLVMSKGIARVNMNQCNGCNFASFWASDPAPGIFSQYYGLIFLTDWLGIGSNSRKGDFQVVSLYSDKNPTVSPYAAFVGGKLDRLAVIDLTEWNTTETTPRPQRAFQIGVGNDVNTAELRRLTGKGTNSTNDGGDITYAGTQWTVASPGGVKVGQETESVALSGGKVSFDLKASEAVLVTLHR